MGQAKQRGSQQDRIQAAKARNDALQNKMRAFAQEVGRFSKKTGLELGAVKLDARFVIVEFDKLVEFVERREKNYTAGWDAGQEQMREDE